MLPQATTDSQSVNYFIPNYNINASTAPEDFFSIGQTSKYSPLEVQALEVLDDDGSVIETGVLTIGFRDYYTEQWLYGMLDGTKWLIEFSWGTSIDIDKPPYRVSNLTNIITNECPSIRKSARPITSLSNTPSNITDFCKGNFAIIGLQSQAQCATEAVYNLFLEYCSAGPFPPNLEHETIPGYVLLGVELILRFFNSLRRDNPNQRSLHLNNCYHSVDIMLILLSSLRKWYILSYTSYAFAHSVDDFSKLFFSEESPIPPFYQSWALLPATVHGISNIITMCLIAKAKHNTMPILMRGTLKANRAISTLLDSTVNALQTFYITATIISKELIEVDSIWLSISFGIATSIIAALKTLRDQGFMELEIINRNFSRTPRKWGTILTYIFQPFLNSISFATLFNGLFFLQVLSEDDPSSRAATIILLFILGAYFEVIAEKNNTFDIIRDTIQAFISGWVFMRETAIMMDLANENPAYVAKAFAEKQDWSSAACLFALASALNTLLNKNAKSFHRTIASFEQNNENFNDNTNELLGVGRDTLLGGRYVRWIYELVPCVPWSCCNSTTVERYGYRDNDLDVGKLKTSTVVGFGFFIAAFTTCMYLLSKTIPELNTLFSNSSNKDEYYPIADQLIITLICSLFTVILFAINIFMLQQCMQGSPLSTRDRDIILTDAYHEELVETGTDDPRPELASIRNRPANFSEVQTFALVLFISFIIFLIGYFTLKGTFNQIDSERNHLSIYNDTAATMDKVLNYFLGTIVSLIITFIVPSIWTYRQSKLLKPETTCNNAFFCCGSSRRDHQRTPEPSFFNQRTPKPSFLYQRTSLPSILQRTSTPSYLEMPQTPRQSLHS